MHIACMATKTISLKLQAWERLRRARRSPDESFSEVVMRAQWPEVGITAEELLAVYGSTGPHLSEEALDRIQDADTSDQPPEDKWDRH
jgi:predicted CopG family antitoxin